MSLDVVVNFHRRDRMEIWNDVTCVVVVTSWELSKVGGQEMLFVKDGEIKIIERRRVVWSR